MSFIYKFPFNEMQSLFMFLILIIACSRAAASHSQNDTDLCDVSTDITITNQSITVVSNNNCDAIYNLNTLSPNSNGLYLKVIFKFPPDLYSYVYLEQVDSTGLQCSKKVLSLSSPLSVSASSPTPCAVPYATKAIQIHVINMEIKMQVTELRLQNCPTYMATDDYDQGVFPKCNTTEYDTVYVMACFLIQRERVKCISGCTCTLGYKLWKFSCVAGNDGNVLMIYPRNLTRDCVNLDRALIDNITPFAFRGLSASGLILTNNRLKQIERDAFAGIVKLVNLYLSSNYLTTLSVNVYQSLNSLKYLNIENNRLTSVSSDSFNGLFGLEDLSLRFNNLSSLPLNFTRHLTSLRLLDVSYNNLTEVPTCSHAFAGIVELVDIYLNGNYLTTLSANVFQSVNSLKVLNIENNRLTSVSSDSFNGLFSLEDLSLRLNNLSSLPLNFTRHLTSLRFLDVSYNHLTEVSTGSLVGLGNLNYLILRCNELNSFEKDSLGNLSNLTILEVEGNKLVSISNGTFSRLNELRILTMSRNKLTTILRGTFCGLNKLERLDISYNAINSLLKGSFFGLRSLTALDISRNLISSLPSLFDTPTKLLFLDIANNRLTTVPGDIADLADLIALDMEHNELSSLPLNELRNVTRLRHIDVSNNYLRTLRSGLSIDLPRLELFYLSQNELVSLPSDISNLRNIQLLYLSQNELVSLPSNISNLRNIQILKLDHNQLVSLPSDISNLRNIQLLKLDHNQLVSIPELSRSKKLLFLRLDGNHLSSLSNYTFPIRSILKDLILSNNALTSLPSGLFINLPKLERLHLSQNELVSLPYDISNLRNIQILLLDHNRLVSIPKLNHFKKLRIMQVDGNNISSLSDDTFPVISCLDQLILSDNALTSLQRDIFSKQRQLTILDVSSNRLIYLTSGIFQENRRLKKLLLHHNMIVRLPDNLFTPITNLLILTLHHNSLSSTFFQLHDPIKVIILKLYNNNLVKLQIDVFHNFISVLYLDISHNNLEIIHQFVFRPLVNLMYLNVSINNLKDLPSFHDAVNLETLDFSRNDLATLGDEYTFGNLSRLALLYLDNNQLRELAIGTFDGLTDLLVLSVRNNKLTRLLPGSFKYSQRLISLRLSDNKIRSLTRYLFLGLNELVEIDLHGNLILSIQTDTFIGSFCNVIDLRSNPLSLIQQGSFHGLNNTTILVDDSTTCCFDRYVKRCLAANPPSVYLTCHRMLDNISVRMCMWVIGIVAVGCNVAVFFLRFGDKQHSVQKHLILNLSISDSLMGMSMLLLAAFDVYYADYFPSYSDTWRHDGFCNVVGVLSILSSEASVFFITLISIDRCQGATSPFGSYRLRSTSVRICSTLIWSVSIALSIIPVLMTRSYPEVFQLSEVCVGIPLVMRPIGQPTNSVIPIDTVDFSLKYYTRVYYSGYHIDQSKYYSNLNLPFEININNGTTNFLHMTSIISGYKLATYFSIIVFIGINMICFLTVAGLYIAIFVTAKRSARNAGRSRSHGEEFRMAAKMSVLVFTDFFTWVPLVIACILAQSRVISVDPVLYTWTVALILPINSAINPFLYTLATAIVESRMRKQNKRK